CRRTVSPAVRKKEAKARDVVAMRRLRHRAAAVGEDALIPNAAESVAAGVPRHDKTDPTLGLEQERRRNGITLDRVTAQAPACRASTGIGTPEAFECGFFFQAEDGIRDLYVTGVQTCALPI